MTTPTLPPEIKVIHDSLSLTRYVLPKRNLGAARKMGWVPIGFGVFVTIFMIFWMSGPISSGVRGQGVGQWLSIGFGLLGLPGLVVGLGLIGLGIAILTNIAHSEIVVGEGLICAIERIGVLPIRRKRLVSELHLFVVQKGGITVKNNNTGATTTYAPELASLEVETTTGKPMKLVMGYPYELLRPLADVLASSLSLGGQSSPLESPKPMIEVVVKEAGMPDEIERSVPKPAGTDIMFQEDARGLAISVPPKGLWKGSQGLFLFSLMWNGFMAVFTVLMFKGRPPLPVYLFVLGFWGIGILILCIAVNMAKKKVLIAVTNGVLAYRVMGPFKTSEQKIPLDIINTIQVGPSGMEVNDRPVIELQIIPKSGKKIGLLSNRSDDEKQWLAYILRQTLKKG